MVGQKTQKGLIGAGSAGLVLATMLIMSGVNVFECSTTGQYASFDRLSSTHKTGYWTDEMGEHSKVCSKGEWVEVKIDKQEVQDSLNNPVVNMAGWTCTKPVKD